MGGSLSTEAAEGRVVQGASTLTGPGFDCVDDKFPSFGDMGLSLLKR